VPNKGTFKALATKGYKDKKGLPIGLDYLASLGVSHIQLMPVLDFQTVDEDDPFSM
jgi:pullulanase/glycogen debranching enzyme